MDEDEGMVGLIIGEEMVDVMVEEMVFLWCDLFFFCILGWFLIMFW